MKKLLLSIIIILFSFANSKAQLAETPVIDSLTVNVADSLVGIYWSYNDKESIEGYRIKRRVFGVSGVIDGSFVNVITIDNPNQTWFIDTTTIKSLTNTSIRQEAYVVEAYHFDGINYEYSNLSEEHKTIHLTDIVFDNCSNKNTLTWYKYYGWGEDIANYEIHYLATGMSNIQILTTLSGTDTTYIHENLQSNKNYFYFIRAKYNGGQKTSSSNYKLGFTRQPLPPTKMNADFTEVISSNKLKLTFSIDLNSEITDFVLFRTSDLNTSFDTLAKPEINTFPFEYVDSIDIQKQYFYKIEALNNCKKLIKETNILSNIVLRQNLDANEFGLVNLDWSEYKEYEAGLQTYKLMRQVGVNTAEELISTTDLSYSDAAGDLINNMVSSGEFGGNICYYVEAVENLGNSAGVLGISTSNKSCIQLEPQIFAPNAFNPQSYIEKNNVFKPYVSFAKTYKMQIISRWGNVVFETEDINEGWNGRINGDYAREGTYIYVIKLTAPNDEYFEKSGNITVFY